MSEPIHPLHHYCPTCQVWKELDGIFCATCGTKLYRRSLGEPAMSLEEAVQWCTEHEVDVSFSVVTHNGTRRVFVHIYQDMTASLFEQISEGDSLIDAVTQARKVFT